MSLKDEPVLSGYGDPVGGVVRQLRMSIEDKMDSDALAELERPPDTRTIIGKLDFDTVCKAVGLFDAEKPGEAMTLPVSDKGLARLRKEERFNGGSGSADGLAGTVGFVAGCKGGIEDPDSMGPASRRRRERLGIE